MKTSSTLTKGNCRYPELVALLSRPLLADHATRFVTVDLDSLSQSWVSGAGADRVVAGPGVLVRSELWSGMFPRHWEIGVLVGKVVEMKPVLQLNRGDVLARMIPQPPRDFATHEYRLTAEQRATASRCKIKCELADTLPFTDQLLWFVSATAGNASSSGSAAVFSDPCLPTREAWADVVHSFFSALSPELPRIFFRTKRWKEVIVSNIAFALLLKDLVGGGARNKCIHESFLDADDRGNRHLAAGFGDTDSHVPLALRRGVPPFEFASTSPRLAVQAYRIFSRAGYNPYLGKRTQPLIDRKTGRRIGTSIHFVVRIRQSDYAWLPPLPLRKPKRRDRTLALHEIGEQLRAGRQAHTRFEIFEPQTVTRVTALDTLPGFVWNEGLEDRIVRLVSGLMIRDPGNL